MSSHFNESDEQIQVLKFTIEFEKKIKELAFWIVSNVSHDHLIINIPLRDDAHPNMRRKFQEISLWIIENMPDALPNYFPIENFQLYLEASIKSELEKKKT